MHNRKGAIINAPFLFSTFMNMALNSFGKAEKLSSKRAIDALFANGRSFKEYPFKVLYDEVNDNEANTQVLISVPKRRFSKAVTRNRIKRLIRETYRLSKQSFIEKSQSEGKYFALAFVYIGKDIPKYGPLKEAMQNALQKINTQN